MHTLRLWKVPLSNVFSEHFSNITGGGTVTPTVHNLVIVRKGLANGNVGYCSCGEWKVVGGKNEFATEAANDTAMQARHAVHVARLDSE